MLSSPSKIPHVPDCLKALWAWSTPPVSVVFGGFASLPSYAFICSVCRSSLNQSRKSHSLLQGLFLSNLGCWSNSRTWLWKLNGPSLNQSFFRLSDDKVWQGGLSNVRAGHNFNTHCSPSQHHGHEFTPYSCCMWKRSLLRRLKWPWSRHPCSLRAKTGGGKNRTMVFLKCQAVGLPLKYLSSPFLSILIDKATFDNAACCHRDIWSALFSFFPLFFTWLAAE